jgi:transposase
MYVYGYEDVCACTQELIATWTREGKSGPDIASLLGRDKGTIHRHIVKKTHVKASPKLGRKKLITDKVLKQLMRARDRLIRRADARWDVIMKMIKAEAGCTACERTIWNAFGAAGVHFRKFKEKPPLTKDDVRDRAAFGEKHKGPRQNT